MQTSVCKFLIVGSGPSGIAACKALLDAGHAVTMIDSGISENNQHQIKSSLGTKTSERISLRGIPIKRKNGSSFPYQIPDTAKLSLKFNRAEIRPSFAQGGFSNVWGCATIPYRTHDFEQWPVDLEQLNPHYDSVSQLFSLFTDQDSSAEQFPVFSSKLKPHPCPPILHSFETPQLRTMGSRIAVNNNKDCTPCGSCLDHCASEVLFNSKDILSQFKRNGRFTYLDQSIVLSFREQLEKVSVMVQSATSHKHSTIECEKLYLGSGVLSTFSIIGRSLSQNDFSRIALDSQQYVLPIFFLKPTANSAGSTKLSTFTRATIELKKNDTFSFPLMLQVYGYNPLYQKFLDTIMGESKFAHLISKKLSQHLGVIQGYYPSQQSPEIKISMKNDSQEITISDNLSHRESRPNLLKIQSVLLRNFKRLGFIPLPGLSRLQTTGRGFHTGGTFPMKQIPGEYETDSLGRLRGFNHIHIVDASVFPSIPSGPITFTVMANAHRIAATSGALIQQ